MERRELRMIQLRGLLMWPFLASFVASLYLPHTNPWWRVSMFCLAAFGLSSFISNYRRREAVKRRQQEQQRVG